MTNVEKAVKAIDQAVIDGEISLMQSIYAVQALEKGVREAEAQRNRRAERAARKSEAA